MIGRNDRSATICRRSGANRVRARVTEYHWLQGRRAYLLLKHGKEAGSTSQHQDGGSWKESVTHHVPAHPMLSAFHARKARLAAASGVPEPTVSLTPTNPDLQSPPQSSTPRRSSRKRKPEPLTGIETEHPQRRKKTGDRKIGSKIRYFDAPVGVPEPDLDSLTDEDISLSDQEILSQLHVQPRRAWSPDQPPLDSSEEEMETEFGGVQAANTSIAAPTTVPFSVEIGVNTFPLTPEECFTLINLEEPAVIMLLPIHSNITLIGVYKLVVLQGATMVMGVTLVPSNASHAVFSPKLSPLPCIESLGNTSPAPPLISHVPDRLRPWISPDHAIILIRAHPTGIEGLGRAMRTFESMFQSPQPAVDPGIPGVYVLMVCVSLGL